MLLKRQMDLYTTGDGLESKTKFWSWYMRALRGQIEAAAHPTLSDRISRERALDRALLNYPSHPNTRSYIPHADPLIPRPAYTSYYNPDLGRVVPRYGTVYDPDTLPKPQYSSTYYPDTYGRPWYYDPYFFYRYSY